MHRARWFRPGRCQVSDAFTEFGISGKEGSRLVHLSPVSPASKNTSVHTRPRSIIVHRAQTSLCARRITFFLFLFFFLSNVTPQIFSIYPLPPFSSKKIRGKQRFKHVPTLFRNEKLKRFTNLRILSYLFVELSFSL